MTERAFEYQVAIERVSDVQRKLAVEIPWTEVKGRLDEAYVELSRGVSIKGFRRGKVPRKMLEQLFGKHVHEEVAQRLAREGVAKAIGEHKITAIADPEIEPGELADGQSFCFSALLEVLPEVEPKDYFGVEVTQRPAKVSDEDVDRALHGKQAELTQYQPIEGRQTQAGDVLLVDILGKAGDRPISADQELVELSETPREPLPGLAAALTGIDPTEKEVEVTLELPVHDHAPGEPCPEQEKKEQARLLVTIRDAKQKVVPALDDELAKDTGDAETLDELKQKLRQQLIEQDEQRARQEARERLIDRLLEQNTVPVVPALIERELDRMSQLQALFMGGRMPGGPEEQQMFRDAMRGDAERSVRGALLVEAIADKENVEVEDAELDAKLEELAARRTQNVAKVRAEYEKEGRIEQLRHSIRHEKTLELLFEKCQIRIADDAPAADETTP